MEQFSEKATRQPLLVEIIAYAPTAFYHCTHCEVAWREMGKSNRVQEEQLESSLPEDLQREYLAVSDWVREIFQRHCDRVVVKVIDAASVEGFYKSLKYGVRRYPAVIVNGKSRFVGSQGLETAGGEIDRLLTGVAADATVAQSAERR
ncbi:MAG: hypothetical protein ACOYYF_03860 [Chloroflexota bacterium]|nr:DUF1525 domain-containing protein [Chloroflexota bacterium]MBI5703811.1 DUF1525 domain-containing protein [Chloroflexota bacterium]